MKLSQTKIERTCKESDIYNELLQLDDKRILELGCGSADITRDIAENGSDRQLIAFEVDEQQHAKNLIIGDLPNVKFELGAAQAIPVAAASQDIVFMFKSLHHVPNDKLDSAMQEIHRVLSDEGVTYISEPVFAGNFNEIVRLFHDEEEVRIAAFNAVKKSLASGLFELLDEVFFNMPVSFDNFEDFENKILNVTHNDFQIEDEIYAHVKSLFEQQHTATGAHFLAPMRVDVLRKRA